MSFPSANMPRRLRIMRRLPGAFVAEPFEVLLIFMTFLTGTVTVLVTPDNAIKAAMPSVFLLFWGISLIAGSVVGTFGWMIISRGVTLSRRNYGRQLERLAMIIYMWACGAWSIALMSYGWRGMATALTTLAFSLACGVRAYVIRALMQVHELNRLEAIRDLRRGLER